MAKRMKSKGKTWRCQVSVEMLKHCCVELSDHWNDVAEQEENQQWYNLSVYVPKEPAHRIIPGLGPGCVFRVIGGRLSQGGHIEIVEARQWLRETIGLIGTRGVSKRVSIDKRLKNAPDWSDAQRIKKDKVGLQLWTHTQSVPAAKLLTNRALAGEGPEVFKELFAWAEETARSFEAHTGRPVLAGALHLNSRVPHTDIISCTTDESGFRIRGLGKGPGLVGPEHAGNIRLATAGIIPRNCGNLLRAFRRRHACIHGMKLKNGKERKGIGREPIDVLLNWQTDQSAERLWGGPEFDRLKLEYRQDFVPRVVKTLKDQIAALSTELAAWEPLQSQKLAIPRLQFPQAPTIINKGVDMDEQKKPNKDQDSVDPVAIARGFEQMQTIVPDARATSIPQMSSPTVPAASPMSGLQMFSEPGANSAGIGGGPIDVIKDMGTANAEMAPVAAIGAVLDVLETILKDVGPPEMSGPSEISGP